MYIFNPMEFNKVFELELKVQDKRKKFFAIMGNKQSMQIVKSEVDNEILLWGIEAVKSMYSNITQTQACGAFCHR